MSEDPWPVKCPNCGNASDYMSFWYDTEPKSGAPRCWECGHHHPTLTVALAPAADAPALFTFEEVESFAQSCMGNATNLNTWREELRELIDKVQGYIFRERDRCIELGRSLASGPASASTAETKEQAVGRRRMAAAKAGLSWCGSEYCNGEECKECELEDAFICGAAYEADIAGGRDG